MNSNSAGILYIALMLFIYFLPSMIAIQRSHKNLIGVILVNFLLGWTMIGWVVAIVWAFLRNESEDKASANQTGTGRVDESKPASNIDQLEKLAALKERGLLTDEEFEREKAKLIS